MKRLLLILSLLIGWYAVADRRGQLMQQHPTTASGPSLNTIYGWHRADLLVLNEGDTVSSMPDQSGLANTIAGGDSTVTFHTNAPGTLSGLPIVRMALNNNTALSRNSVTFSPAGPINLGGSMSGITQVLVVRRLYSASFPNIYITTTDFLDTSGSVKTDVTSVTNTIFSYDGQFPLTELIDDWQVLSIRLSNAGNVAELRTNTQQTNGTYNPDVTGDNMGFLNGHMEFAESMWYRTRLSDADLAQTRTYLATKYGITITQ